MTWIDEFLAYLSCERGLAQNTIESYGRDLNQFEEFINDTYGIQLEDVSEDVILSYMKAMRDQGGKRTPVFQGQFPLFGGDSTVLPGMKV